MRYREWSDYFYPGTTTLRNLFGERDAEALAELERYATASQMDRLRAHPVQGVFDLRHFYEVHHRIFQDVYDWAGLPRQAPWLDRMTKSGPDVVNYALGDPATPLVAYGYAPASQTEPMSLDLFTHLAQERALVGLPLESFIGRLAHYWAELNTIHAFREGNARAQSVFIGQLSGAAGHPLDVVQFAENRLLREAFVAARFYARATGDEGRLATVLADAYGTTG